MVEEEITDDSARDVDATDIGSDSGGSVADGVFSEGTSGASGVAPSAYTVVLFAILGCVCWCLGGAAMGYGSLDSEDNGVVTMSSGVQRGLSVVSIFSFWLPYLFTYSCSYPYTIIMCCL